MEHVEVEVRGFVSAETHQVLLERLRHAATLVERSRQVTYYLEHPVDTRIQLSTFGGRVWQKLGPMHAVAREELEVILTRDGARSVLRMFQNLGFRIRVTWYRERWLFETGGMRVALDHTVGYGYIIEVELAAQPANIGTAQAAVRRFLAELGVEEGSKAEFDSAFNSYVATWARATVGLNESWIDVDPAGSGKFLPG